MGTEADLASRLSTYTEFSVDNNNRIEKYFWDDKNIISKFLMELGGG